MQAWIYLSLDVYCYRIWKYKTIEMKKSKRKLIYEIRLSEFYWDVYIYIN